MKEKNKKTIRILYLKNISQVHWKGEGKNENFQNDAPMEQVKGK